MLYIRADVILAFPQDNIYKVKYGFRYHTFCILNIIIWVMGWKWDKDTGQILYCVRCYSDPRDFPLTFRLRTYFPA